MSSLPARMMLIKSKMKELECSQDFSHYMSMGIFTDAQGQLTPHSYELDWNQGPIKILGVTFTPEVFNIWDHNSAELIRKVENTLKNWAKRKITLLGQHCFIH